MISVVMAVYNGEQFLSQQLESLASQTLTPDEILICDDCSSDSTLQIVNNFAEANKSLNITVIKNEQNLGYCRNFLNGILKSRGDLVFLCDQDDIWYNEKIEQVCNAMDDQTIYAISSRYDVIDSNGKIIENPKVTYLMKEGSSVIENISEDSLIGCSWIRGFSLCLRGDIRKFIKPLELKSLLGHDWYLCIIAAMAGRLCFLNVSLAGYRFHSQNVSLSKENHRATMSGSARQKRIKGLLESIVAHWSLVEDDKLKINELTKEKLIKFINFERNRVQFLEGGGARLLVKLATQINSYKRYYKGYIGAIRVLLGDIIYRFKD